jgi:hypothetical protein
VPAWVWLTTSGPLADRRLASDERYRERLRQRKGVSGWLRSERGANQTGRGGDKTYPDGAKCFFTSR